jgi:hypothetical protein
VCLLVEEWDESIRHRDESIRHRAESIRHPAWCTSVLTFTQPKHASRLTNPAGSTEGTALGGSSLTTG